MGVWSLRAGASVALALFGLVIWRSATAVPPSQCGLSSDFFLADEVDAVPRGCVWRAPLSGDVLANASLAAWRRGENADALALSAAAIAQAPRSGPVLAWRTQLAFETGRWADAVQTIDALWRIDRANRSVYARYLAELAVFEASAPHLRAALDDEPEWAGEVLRAAIAMEAPPSVLFALSRRVPDETDRYVTALVRDGQRQRALAVWLGQDDKASALAQDGWPTNPRFEPSRGRSPFDWRASQGAELDPERGLFARFGGRGRPVLAQQLMPLGPGAYRFEASMRGEAPPNAATFSWNLTCAPSGPALGSLRVEGLASEPRAFSFDFEVPPVDCPFQVVALRGEAGELLGQARAYTTQVEITPSGGPAL